MWRAVLLEFSPWHFKFASQELHKESLSNGHLDVFGLVLVTGWDGAGFHFVTRLLVWPGVNSMPFLPTL